VIFPAAGKYWVVLKADDEIILQRPLVVALAEETQGDEES